jgi:hypothetical protein
MPANTNSTTRAKNATQNRRRSVSRTKRAANVQADGIPSKLPAAKRSQTDHKPECALAEHEKTQHNADKEKTGNKMNVDEEVKIKGRIGVE